MEKRVSAANASRRFSELLRGVRMGRGYLITSGSKVIAKLIPVEDSRPLEGGGANRTAHPTERATCVEEHQNAVDAR